MDTKFGSQLSASQSGSYSGGLETLREAFGHRAEGVVTEEREDSRDVFDVGIEAVILPGIQGRRVDADLLGNIGLSKTEVETALANVVAKG